MAETPATTAEELIEEFELFQDWEERYRFIIELGDELPEFPTEKQIEANRVEGCQSNVWMVASQREAEVPIVDYQADSDSQIVRGLIAILLEIYSGRPADEILAFEIEPVFEKLGLKQHLSPSRSNGFRAMVQRMRTFAELAMHQK
ncbi:Sulfur acceptor protein SufE for iron-sulfur cluster assembly [Planctomycetales bacterium 10988]|nr:Sulfur acceptor protein SufE for iron-sulfur cluster assembly [Planctomycetales bacterium 10988]